MKALAVKGGIGDFLQCLPYMLANPERKYLVASHHDCATAFFAKLGLQIDEAPFGRMNGVTLCPRQLFFEENPFRRPPPLFTDGRPVIGVHLGGSDYSLSVEQRFGFPSKALPLQVLDEMMDAAPQYAFLLFGSPAELNHFSGPWRYDLALVCSDDVTENLAHVAECDAFVGSDSCFKTMAAMLRIPTIVWHGDYPDAHRDEKFIDPYVKAGVIVGVCRYEDLDDERELDLCVQFCVREINRLMTAA